MLIDQARKDYEMYGYCKTIGEWRHEINAVGVPLILNNEFGVVSFSCGGPSFMMTQEKIEHDIGPRLRYLVKNVEAILEG